MTTPTMYRYCTKEDDGLTEGAYCSCTAGYEIYACFFFMGRHPVSVMMNTLFLKYISCCCSTSSLGNMPPATTHLKIFRPWANKNCFMSVEKNWCPKLKILHQSRWWFDRRSLLFLHYRVWNLCMFFLFSISCLCSANSGPLDNNRRDCN
jgi:hypothetical protein